MKLLFVLEHYHPYKGGVERLFRSLITELSFHGHEITVVTSRFQNSLPKKERKENGVEIIRVDASNRFSFLIKAIPAAIAQAKSADLIHTSSYTASIPAFIASIIHRKPIVITFHEFFGNQWFELPYLSTLQKYAFYLFEQFIAKLPIHKVVAVSNYTKSRLIYKAGIKPDKVERIYNWMDRPFPSHERRAFDSESKMFCYVGRLGVSKGLDLVLASLPLLMKQTKASFTFIIPKQEGSFIYNEIRSLATRKDYTDRIHLLHDLSDDELEGVFEKSTAVIVPSFSEGFGFVALEACLMNTLLIHSNRGALPEVISGKHIPMKAYDPQALLDAYKEALRGKYLEEPTKNFSKEQSINKYITLYEGLINPS